MDKSRGWHSSLSQEGLTFWGFREVFLEEVTLELRPKA